MLLEAPTSQKSVTCRHKTKKIIKRTFDGKPNRFLYKTAEAPALQRKVCDFPVPSRDVTNQTLISDIPAGDRKIANLFYNVWPATTQMYNCT